MSYGISEFASMEYAGEDITDNGDLDALQPQPIIEEFCANACGPTAI